MCFVLQRPGDHASMVVFWIELCFVLQRRGDHAAMEEAAGSCLIMLCFELNCILFYRDEEIMLRWKKLLDQLDARKSTLSGFHDLMGMFREIESIREELREVEVKHLYVLTVVSHCSYSSLSFFTILSGMVHIKEPLLLIDKSSLCGSSGFPFSLSEWSLTICLMPYAI